jgi:DNA invertase Pin-like site-specific DNA recombinase
MFDREAGRQLLLALRRGDHVVVARLDRLDNTLKGFTRVLDAWSKQGIVTHVLDGPLTVLDPNHPHCIVLIKILAKFAEHERRMIGQRTSQGLAAVKASGRRYCQIAPYGFAWDRCGSEMIMVPEPREQAIGAKAAEMRAEGYSIDQIRQYFAYEWKVTNRNGREFNNAAVHKMAISGAQWLSAEVPQGV